MKIKGIINSGVFASLLAITIFIAQDGGRISSVAEILILVYSTLLTIYVVSISYGRISFILTSRNYQIWGEKIQHLVIVNSDNIESIHLYSVFNRGRNPARSLLTDYEGGVCEEIYTPVYTLHNRSVITNGKISPIIPEKIKTTVVKEFAQNKEINFAEWVVQIEEPLQSKEKTCFSRRTIQDKKNIKLNSPNEFSFRPRIPTKSLEICVVSSKIVFSQVKLFRTDLSGKIINMISAEITPISIIASVPFTNPSFRYVVQFEAHSV
ncbi:hypothetical protein ACFL43_00380 [Thermodesulfobacteriota bacterium]